MHSYEVKNGTDCHVYFDGVEVAFAANWDSEEGAHEWGTAMVERLDYLIDKPEEMAAWLTPSPIIV